MRGSLRDAGSFHAEVIKAERTWTGRRQHYENEMERLIEAENYLYSFNTEWKPEYRRGENEEDYCPTFVELGRDGSRNFQEKQETRSRKQEILELSEPLVGAEKIAKIFRYFFEYAEYMSDVTDADAISRSEALDPPGPEPLKERGRTEADRWHEEATREKRETYEWSRRGYPKREDWPRIYEACQRLDLIQELECEDPWMMKDIELPLPPGLSRPCV